MNTVFVLLIVFQLKHFLADFPLQGPYMLQKFRPDWGFFLPLLAHAAVHGTFTLLITLAVTPDLWWLAIVDMAIHFTMDRIKASPRYLGRYKALTAKDYMAATEAEKQGNTYFWWALGFDQAVHHLTHYGLIWALVSL